MKDKMSHVSEISMYVMRKCMVKEVGNARVMKYIEHDHLNRFVMSRNAESLNNRRIYTSMSCRMNVNDLILITNLMEKKSSEYNKHYRKSGAVRSFVEIMKSVGPKCNPWRTPDLTCLEEDS